MNALVDDSKIVYRDSKTLWQQWEDSSKDYNCGPPPTVLHAASTCSDGNTKFSRKCDVKCEEGYDGVDSFNNLRCNKQGKFGKELYGEWQGMAACVGRVCGQAPKIDKTKTVIQEIRYPHAASYGCYEG